MAELRNLIVVLGDQLDLEASGFDGFDASLDAVWMAEVDEESTHVWSSKPRTALLLTAMRHFAMELQAAARALHYTRLDAVNNAGSLQAQLQADILRLRPVRLVLTAPGDWRVLQAIKAVAAANGLPLDICEDRHFFCTVSEFAAHINGRKSLRMEYFYREQRKRHGVLMQGDKPLGAQWNFDQDNRESFAASGPGEVPARTTFAPDAVTREVIALVKKRFAGHPGSKPYVATGKYIQRMSPHCKGCRYDPAQRSGDDACPFTTLYWDFLLRHQAALAGNPRMALQVKNLARLTDAQKQAVRERAAAVRLVEVGSTAGAADVVKAATRRGARA